ncbi:MAG: hypothetical protein V1755_00165 [Chloroflexota bacterium]
MTESPYPRFLKATLAIVVIALLAGCTLPSSPIQGGQQSVQIVQPPEGAQLNVGEAVSVVSSFSDPGGAKGVILEVNGVAARDDKFYSPMFKGRMDQPWRALQSGPASLCVYLSTSDGQLLRSNCVNVLVGGSLTLTPFVSRTPPSDLTATPTLTSTPGAPSVTATQDSNCRLGPGTTYQVTSSLLVGQTAPITGRNTDSSWWVIQIPGSGECWIWGELVNVAGDTSQVPVKTPPPLPTATLTQPAPLTAPSPNSPSGTLNCADVTGGLTLSWSAVTHPNGIDHYEWALQGGVNNSGTTGSTQADVNLINCGAAYQWRVRVVDGLSNIGPWSAYMLFNVP